MKRDVTDMIMLPVVHAKRIWLLVLVSGVFLIGNAAIKPQLEPLSPADLEVDRLASQQVTSLNEDSLDFIFRPLFYTSRRPQVAPAVVVEEAASDETLESAQASQLSEYQLLGIFASGAVEGVIVWKKDDERTRVYVGEALEGWRLTRSTSRGALFENSVGETFKMELSVASSLPDLPVVAVAAPEAAQKGPVSDGIDAPEASESAGQPSAPPKIDRPSGSMSFASMQARKRERAERELQSRQANGE